MEVGAISRGHYMYPHLYAGDKKGQMAGPHASGLSCPQPGVTSTAANAYLFWQVPLDELLHGFN